MRAAKQSFKWRQLRLTSHSPMLLLTYFKNKTTSNRVNVRTDDRFCTCEQVLTFVMFSGGLEGKLGEEKVNPLSVPAS